MNLGHVALAVVGGVGASWLDTKYAAKAQHVAGFTLEPGMMAGAGALVLGMIGVPAARYLAAAGVGAVAFEGGKIGATKFLPGPAQATALPGSSTAGIPGALPPLGLLGGSRSYSSLADAEVLSVLDDIQHRLG